MWIYQNFSFRLVLADMTPQTPSSSGSDSSKGAPKSGEERLMVAVRIRPLKADEAQRVLYASGSKKVIYVQHMFFQIKAI